ncbi:MAG: mechanosensitive ion channel family protein [Acidimicrobiia bacterium]
MEPEFIHVLAQVSQGDACGDDPGLVCSLILEVTGSDGLAQASDWIARPLNAIVILIFTWLVNVIVRRFITRAVERVIVGQQRDVADAVADAENRARSERRPSLQQRSLARAMALRESSERSTLRTRTVGNVVGSLASGFVYLIGITIALGEFGVNLGPLIAGAGIVGVALGFGAQSLVKDFLSGMFMFIEDQYGVGDVIDIGEATGVVEVVNLRTTRIRDVDGTLWHVPNGEIRRVANKSQEWARAVLDIEVSYDTDMSHAMQVIKRVADQVWDEAHEEATILEEPELWGVEAFGESAIAIRLVMKVEPSEQWATARLIRERIKAAFDAEGIEIPFPQRTVWLRQPAEPSVSAGERTESDGE